jgi:hypothetical protein
VHDLQTSDTAADTKIAAKLTAASLGELSIPQLISYLNLIVCKTNL